MTTLPFHNIVAMYGWTFDKFNHTVNLGLGADSVAISAADEGKAVTVDTSGPNKFKLCGDGDVPLAYLNKYDGLGPFGQIGTISFKFIEKFWLLANDTAGIGDTVQGSVGGDGHGGWVKKASANDPTHNFIVEKGTDSVTGNTYVVVVKL